MIILKANRACGIIESSVHIEDGSRRGGVHSK